MELIADAPGYAQPHAVVVDVEESAPVQDRTRLLRWAATDAMRRSLTLHLVHLWCPWGLRLGETLAAAHGMCWTLQEDPADRTAPRSLLASAARRVRSEFPGLSVRATLLRAGRRMGLPAVAEGADSIVIGASAGRRRPGAGISPLCSAVAEVSGVPVVQHRPTGRAHRPVLAVADRLSDAEPLIQRAAVRAAAGATSARIMLLLPAQADVDQDVWVSGLEAELFDRLVAARRVCPAAPLSGMVVDAGSEHGHVELASPTSLLMLAWPRGRDIRSRVRRARLDRLARRTGGPVALVPVCS